MESLPVNNKECPLCGKEKRRAKDLVCNDCYQAFTSEAGRMLAQKGKITSFGEWIKPQATEKLQSLQAQLNEVTERYSALQKEVKNEAYAQITASLKQYVVMEIFKKALREKERILWGQKGGNKLHWERKGLEARITFLKGFLEKFPEKAAEVAQEPQPAETPGADTTKTGEEAE